MCFQWKQPGCLQADSACSKVEYGYTRDCKGLNLPTEQRSSGGNRLNICVPTCAFHFDWRGTKVRKLGKFLTDSNKYNFT